MNERKLKKTRAEDVLERRKGGGNKSRGRGREEKEEGLAHDAPDTLNHPSIPMQPPTSKAVAGVRALEGMKVGMRT